MKRLEKNFFKIVVPLFITKSFYSLLATTSPDKKGLVMVVSVGSGLTLGVLIGAIIDYKIKRRAEAKEFRNNIAKISAAVSNPNKGPDKQKDNYRENIISDLEKLNNMKKDNIITEIEYEKIKKSIMEKV